MFDDARSQKVVLVAHCLLNQNSISDGTADFPSQFEKVLEVLLANRVGIIQMPCPELTCLGLDRGDEDGAKRPLLQENTRIRELLISPEHAGLLRKKAEGLAAQIQEYQRHGFQVLGVIGVNRSPSCGVETTSRDGMEVHGQGVFIELLSEVFELHGIAIPQIGSKTSEVSQSIESVRQLCERIRP
jgi:predicted secreted protein